IFKIENFTLYYHIVDNNHEDQAWCIEHFGTFSEDIGSGSLKVEDLINNFVEKEKENFSGEKILDQNTKDFKAFKDEVFDRFKDVEYKELCPIDEIFFKDDTHIATKDEHGEFYYFIR